MAAITWTDVEAHAPELSTANATVQADMIGMVEQILVAAEFGGEDDYRYRMARIYLAAHLATVAASGGAMATGGVQSERVGDVSRTYSTTTLLDPDSLDSTAYGRAYRAIVRISPARSPRCW